MEDHNRMLEEINREYREEVAQKVREYYQLEIAHRQTIEAIYAEAIEKHDASILHYGHMVKGWLRTGQPVQPYEVVKEKCDTIATSWALRSFWIGEG